MWLEIMIDSAMQATITIDVLGDTTDEADETFFVLLSNAVACSLADDRGLGTIEDNDAAPALSIDDVSVVEGHFTGLVTVATDLQCFPIP